MKKNVQSEMVFPSTALPHAVLQMIQAAKQRFRWRDLLCQKDPFDLAIYSMLLWQQKPRTIIEVGTKYGGSALWLSDTCRALGLETQIITIDTKQHVTQDMPNIRFMKGDGRRLDRILSPTFMQSLLRPLLVIEDADHHYLTTIAVLEFMDRHLLPGEYIVVEDGIVDALHDNVDPYGGGPNRAISEFLANHRDYEIDRTLCDFYGPNVTWNTNGYIRRRRKTPDRSALDLGL